MAKKLTPAQKAAQTRKSKQELAMKDLGFERTKVKRTRKPMSEEQKAAAVERLRLAREKRGADGSKSVHHSIRDLPEDHFIHWKKVKEWIKECTQELGGKSSYRDSKVAKERMEYVDLKVYIANMKKYLTTGFWGDFRHGANREGRVGTVCVAMAYYNDGRPKRSYGTWYPDISTTWTKELEEEWGRDYDDELVAEKKKLRRSKINNVESEIQLLDNIETD
jgi:hypothetical protein|tara:strand:- start:26730 stop:27392 length:663 start_codon:yes stop_codon:yes gene_type:complete